MKDWLEGIIMRLFRTKVITEEDGYRCTTYYFRGRAYVTEFKKIKKKE